jgi:hypothetical protein
VTGIDYLAMVQAAHEDDTIGTIHYREIPLPGLGNDHHGEVDR